MPEQLCSPVSLLASFLCKIHQIPALILVTGESGAGKTAWCLELIRQARLIGLAPSGLVSPAVWQAGVKVAIDLVEVRSGKDHRLATRRDEASPAALRGEHTRGWRFDPTVLAWGNRILERLPVGDFLIVDELGPLEFELGQGLTAGLALLNSRRYRLACIMVRPSLLHLAQARWPWSETMQIASGGPA